MTFAFTDDPIPSVPDLDMTGIGRCDKCTAPPARRATFGWLACIHQIEIAEATPF